MDLEYRWKTLGVAGRWYLVSATDDRDGYDDTARQALSIPGVKSITFHMGDDGSKLQYRRAKK